jgi:hypothetical protein
LQKAPELNGELARVERWNPEHERWEVQLQNGDDKRVRPENLRGNPREMAAEFLADMETSLKNFDDTLQGLAIKAARAEANLEAVREQKRSIDELPSCPSQVLATATALMSQAQSNSDEIQSHTDAANEERDATLANGKLFVMQLVSKFMKHGEG